MSNYYNRQWRLPNNENKDKQSNYSMDFDGTNYIDLGDSVPPFNQTTSKFSISFWLNRENTTTNKCVFENRGSSLDSGISLEIRPGNTVFYFWIYPSTGGGTITTFPISSVAINQWNHIAIVFDGTQTGNTNRLKIYVNNTSLTLTYLHNVPSDVGGSGTGDNFRLAEGLQANFQGKMDAFSMFNYPLSASQITTIYGSSSTGIGNPMSLNPKPVAYYPLGDQDSFNGANYLVPNSSLKDYVFSFDGTNDYIDTNFTLPASYTSYSYSIWYKQTSSFTGDNYLIGNWNQGSSAIADMRVSVRFNGGTKLRIITGNNTTAFQSTDLDVSSLLLDGNWHHIAVTVISGEIKLYIDKNLEATHSNSNIVTGIVANRSYALGFSGNTFFAGYLDNSQLSNFQIFNSALPATGSNSVETLYNNGSPLTSMSGFTSLQGWWKLDASELYSDSWSVENNASPTTFKSALDFDSGSGDYLQVPNTTDFDFGTGDFTWSLWINYETHVNYSGLLVTGTSNSEYRLKFQLSGQILFMQNADGDSQVADLGTNITGTGWHHLCLVRNSGTITTYLDGSAVDTDSRTGNVNSNGNDLLIGRNGSSYFNGKISNVAIYNTALSASNITTLYNNGVPQATIYGSPVSHWKLDNTTTGIQDSAGSNNGTNNGATEVATYVNTTAGTSSGMTQANLVQSDLSFKTSISPFAFNFDGTNRVETTFNPFTSIGANNDFTISAWVKPEDSSVRQRIFGVYTSSNNSRFWIGLRDGVRYGYGSGNTRAFSPVPTISSNQWSCVVITFNYSTTLMTCFINGQAIGTRTHTETTTPANGNCWVGNVNNDSSLPFNGDISNVSVWNAALTSSQVSEIYNEGVPSNLNNHSAYSNLLSWWQLGSNSSWVNPDWTVLDEKGSKNGTSVNMAEDVIVDGVNTYGGGTSSGMGGDEVIGDAPYSTANSLSVNMDVEDRVSDTPS